MFNYILISQIKREFSDVERDIHPPPSITYFSCSSFEINVWILPRKCYHTAVRTLSLYKLYVITKKYKINQDSKDNNFLIIITKLFTKTVFSRKGLLRIKTFQFEYIHSM